jgi:hypothetical protein
MNKLSYFALLVLISFTIYGCRSPQSSLPALVGSNAPEFILDDAQGGQTALSDFQGTPVLLFFHMAVG